MNPSTGNSEKRLPDSQRSTEVELARLILKAREGDQAAMGELLVRYRGYLLLIANQDLCPDIRAKLGASDVVQQSLLNAQQHFDQFHGECEQELLAWLRTILQNNLLKARRSFSTNKRDVQQEVNLQDHSKLGRTLFDGSPNPAHAAIQKERVRLLEEAMEELSEDHQAVIRLRNFEQLPFSEIGQRLGRSADAARKLWSRAIQELQTPLAGKEEELLTGTHPMNSKDDISPAE